MGRNKIKIERIESERKRTATYTKRSHGLIKKAMELSILCDCEVSLFIFTNEKLVVYSSREVKDTLIKFVEFKSNYYSYSNADYPSICHSTSIPEDMSDQRNAAGVSGITDPTLASKDASGMPDKMVMPTRIMNPSLGDQMTPHIPPMTQDFYDPDRRVYYDQLHGMPQPMDFRPPPADTTGYSSYPSVYNHGYGSPFESHAFTTEQHEQPKSKFQPVDIKTEQTGPDPAPPQLPPKKPGEV